MTYATAWTCAQDLVITTQTDCVVTATSTESESIASSTSDQPTYLDWVVMNGFLLFFISIMVYGVLFREFGQKYRKIP